RWSEGRGPRGMRASKARSGRRAGQTCHRRWNAYGKHWPSHTRDGSRMRESRPYGSVRGACDATHVPTATAASSSCVRIGRPSDCADEVTLARKGAKSPTRLRSTGTKARARVSNGPNSLIELKKQLEARTRELAEARGHLSEALERQAATSE